MDGLQTHVKGAEPRCWWRQTQSLCLPTPRMLARCWWAFSCGQADRRSPGRGQGSFFILCYYSAFFFFFILTLFFSFFPLQPIACGIPVHEPEIRPEPLRQEHWIQTAGVTENFRSQGMSVTVWCPGSPRCNAKTQLCPTSHRSHSWSPQARQLTRQEHSPSHPKQRDDKNYVTDERVR